MRIIEEHLEGAFYDSRIFSEYFGGKKIAAADIETTGLSPKYNSVFLGGVVVAEGKGLLLRQYFAESPGEERELLEQYGAFLAEQDVIVTYNGNAFDLPFLAKRMKKHKMDPGILDNLYPLDLYRVISKYSHLKKLLPDLKQKTVEIYMGDSVDRTDVISGKETAELYEKYVNCDVPYQRDRMEAPMLLHNRDDVVRLADMLRILRNLDLHRILFSEGIPLTAGDCRMILGEVKIKNREIEASGRTAQRLQDHIFYGEGSTVRISGKKQKVEVSIPCEEVDGFLVADVKGMGLDDGPLQLLGGYESGYLIVRDKKGRVMYHEVNRLLASVVEAALQ